MPESEVVAQPPVVPTELLDDRGVPLKNKIAELERKLQDAITNNQTATLLNEQYQRELGRLLATQQQPQPQASPDVLSQFDEPSKQMVRRIAMEVAQEVRDGTLHTAQLNNDLSNPEVRKLAEQHFQTMQQNPFYARQPREAQQEIAVLRAKVDYQALQTKTGAGQPAPPSAIPANTTGLPSTGDNPVQTANDKEKYIREFMADPAQRRFVQGGWKMNPDSPEGQAKLKSIAETAWGGVDLSPKIGLAVQAMGGNIAPQGGTR